MTARATILAASILGASAGVLLGGIVSTMLGLGA